jgi:hypothetical protein
MLGLFSYFVLVDCGSCTCGTVDVCKDNKIFDSETQVFSQIFHALEEIPVLELINEAKLYWNNPKRLSYLKQWDMIFNVVFFWILNDVLIFPNLTNSNLL